MLLELLLVLTLSQPTVLPLEPLLMFVELVMLDTTRLLLTLVHLVTQDVLALLILTNVPDAELDLLTLVPPQKYANPVLATVMLALLKLHAQPAKLDFSLMKEQLNVLLAQLTLPPVLL